MRRNPPAKWVLPETVDPPVRRCIQISVPDDPAHIAAFRGAMLALASAYNWADDTAHTAKDVALVWRGIIDASLEWGCMDWNDLVFRQDDCGLYVSTDGGATETLIYDGLTCLSSTGAQAIVGDYIADWINDAIADGLLAQNGASGAPQSAPLAGDCTTYHVVLRANEQWVIPVPLSPGMTIQVTNAIGGWNDGAVYWYCPDGNSYGLGICTPNTSHTEVTDPIPTIPHMQVIGKLTTDSTYFDPMSGSYEVPVGATADQNGVLQCNDSSFSDNSGEVQFDVEICTLGWTHTFDWTQGVYGWTFLPSNTVPQGTQDSSGLHPADFTYGANTRARQLYIQSPIIASTVIRRVQAYSQYTAGTKTGQSYDWLIRDQSDANVYGVTTPNLVNGTNTIPVWSGSHTLTRVKLLLNCSNTNWSGSGLVTKVIISGDGTDPF